MTTKRLAILLAVMLGGMSSVALLPRQLGFQPVGIELALPEFLGEWWGHDAEVTEKERTTLGYDTEFARKNYTNGGNGQILTSIVLAGQDMMTGIHRPERCLYAQGWTVGENNLQVLDVPAFGPLRTTRLLNSRKIVIEDKVYPVRDICYYWFVGCDELAATHGERVWIDSRDRIVRGYNQRWAMVMISSEITRDHYKFGHDERETDAMLQNFIKLVSPKILKASIKHG
jgi:EpsI family protein